MASRVTQTKQATSASGKTAAPGRPPHDNEWAYSMSTFMKAQMGKPIDEDFMNNLLGVLKMAPADKAKIPTSEDIDMEFSEDSIRKFETRYSVKPLGDAREVTLTDAMTRRMALYLKLHLKGVKSIKLPSIASYTSFEMRGEPYQCEQTGLLIHVDQAMITGKVTRIISADVLAFTSEDQPESEATKHTFIFGLLAPLRKGKFEAKEIYPLGWYATIVRPVEFEEHEGVWYSSNYTIKSELDDEIDSSTSQ